MKFEKMTLEKEGGNGFLTLNHPEKSKALTEMWVDLRNDHRYRQGRPSKALELIATGDIMSPQKAERIGLLTKMVPPAACYSERVYQRFFRKSVILSRNETSGSILIRKGVGHEYRD